ncbi:MAG TPA: biliverdin-producing heme oxygenase [Stellaceae bacterium]|jgi:heme oxygenase|nr:biliverdin-producing heme oxygenase [Stellaceae bacterium]
MDEQHDRTGGRRSRLKEVTDTVHRNLDRTVAATGYLKTRAGYMTYLALTLRARQPVETALDRSGAERLYPRWPHRRIAEALRHDLRDLGAAPEPKLQETMIVPWSDGGILGALYVLEGASLGAQLLAKQISALGFGPDFGAQHIGVQTEDPSAFRAFVNLLETAVLDEADEAACVASAVSTFKWFERAYLAAE